jgi:transcriptional antiterminator RfaH
MTSLNTRWYVVQTRPNAENKALQHLLRQGFETYLPRYLKKRRHARKVETVAAPLFPRYLFVAIDTATQRWRSIQSTIGVANLVRHGDEPQSVDEAIVNGLRLREDARGYIQLERRVSFHSGDKVRVLDGVFSESLGLFDGIADSERVTILLDLLGRKVRVLLNLDSVAAA